MQNACFADRIKVFMKINVNNIKKDGVKVVSVCFIYIYIYIYIYYVDLFQLQDCLVALTGIV